MNVHFLIEAVENLERAVECTPGTEERAEIIAASDLVCATLRKRGVFLGQSIVLRRRNEIPSQDQT